jgi:hypothetical protein
MEMKLLLQFRKQWTFYKLATHNHWPIPCMSFWSIKNAYKWFIEVENKHNDNLRHQRFNFVTKHFKEFDTANVRKFEAIKRDWNPLWYIVNNDQCLLATNRLKFP